MTIARIAPWAVLVSFLAAVQVTFLAALPVAAQNWPSNAPAANAPAAGPGQFPPANAPAPAATAGPGQFPPANAPTALPAQPGAVPPPSQWGGATPQHPAWGGGGGGAPIGGMARPGAASGGAMPCASELMPLRDDAQNKGAAIKAASDRKDRAEVCKALKTFVAAEAKFVKFVTSNSERCGIPPDAVKIIKGNHSKSTTARNQVCNAAGPGTAAAPPLPPSLSDALGTSRIPDSSNIKTGKGGTFDTLGGSAIAR